MGLSAWALWKGGNGVDTLDGTPFLGPPGWVLLEGIHWRGKLQGTQLSGPLDGALVCQPLKFIPWEDLVGNLLWTPCVDPCGRHPGAYAAVGTARTNPPREDPCRSCFGRELPEGSP